MIKEYSCDDSDNDLIMEGCYQTCTGCGKGGKAPATDAPGCPCMALYVMPVCGADGQTYQNDCEARCAGAGGYTSGACSEQNPKPVVFDPKGGKGGDDTQGCCVSFGYGSMMVECCQEFSTTAKSDCADGSQMMGGGIRFEANSCEEAKAKVAAQNKQ